MNQHRRKFHSIPLRRSALTERQARTTGAYVQAHARTTAEDYSECEDEEDEQRALPVQVPRSARVYTDVKGRQVIEQGNKRLVIRHARRPERRTHWLLPAGLGMLAMLLLLLVGMWLIAWWQAHQLDATYGYPRFWQTDQVLGLDHDSPTHPTHLIFQNLGGHILFIVIQAGDLSKAVVYPVVTLQGTEAASIPVTATFADVNGDGRLDILMHLQDQTIVFLNTGTGFKPE